MACVQIIIGEWLILRVCQVWVLSFLLGLWHLKVELINLQALWQLEANECQPVVRRGLFFLEVLVYLPRDGRQILPEVAAITCLHVVVGLAFLCSHLAFFAVLA